MLLRNGHKATNRTEDGVFSYVSIQQRQLLIQKKCRQSHPVVEVRRAFMRLRILALVLLLCFLAVALASAQTYSVKVERGVEVKMRDGVILRGDIFRPDAEGKFPVLLQRTPYRRATWGYDIEFAQRAASRGYVVIMQDVRGRYTSDGDWYPSSTNPTTVTTPSSGWPRNRIPTAKSGCSAALTSAPRKCSPPSRIRRTWRGSVPW